jgi:ELWxxDGT repeat protein
MVKDIHPTTPYSGVHRPNDMAVLNNNIYFAGNDGTHGIELWKSDGTATGTMMVKEINTNTLSSGNPANGINYFSFEITATEDTVIFTADDGIHGKELWKTDGTAAGTALVMDMTPIVYNGNGLGSGIGYMTPVGELAFFNVYSNGGPYGGTTYGGVYVSDGTPEGTFAIANSSSTPHPGGI